VEYSLKIQRKNEKLPSLVAVPANNTSSNPLLHVKTLKGYSEITISLATNFGSSGKKILIDRTGTLITVQVTLFCFFEDLHCSTV
jgi:hypothetical protein